MNQEIINRLSQIAQGEVPTGYKKTKVGIVPEEWEVTSLNKFLLESKELSNDIKNFSVYSSSRRGLLLQSEYYDNKKAVETNLGYKVVPPNYVTYRHMSDDDIFHFNVNITGKSLLVSSEYPVFTLNECAELGFIIPSLNEMPRFRYFCRSMKMGGTRTRLYYKNLVEYRLAIPPLHEQQKIAQILATQDKVIQLKEKMIAQKKEQKKYLMQQLLTGEKRLEGFSGEWEKKSISDMGNIVTGTTPDTNETSYYGGNFPWVTPGDISEDKYLYKTERSLTNEGIKKGRFIPKDSLLVTCIASIGKNALLKTDGSCNQQINAIIPHDNYFVEFLYYLLCYSNNKILKFAGNSTLKIVNKETFSNIVLLLPPLPEQEAIAKILTTADKEIDLLQKDLDQEKLKKKSLMQLLLTGIVRVKL